MERLLQSSCAVVHLSYFLSWEQFTAIASEIINYLLMEMTDIHFLNPWNFTNPALFLEYLILSLEYAIKKY
jgi:hypothetical protein